MVLARYARATRFPAIKLAEQLPSALKPWLPIMQDLAQFEADLWEAADNLRANSKLTSSDYFMPVLGVIFLRHAANRFAAAA